MCALPTYLSAMAVLPTSCIYVCKLGLKEADASRANVQHAISQAFPPPSPLKLLMRTLNYTPRQAVVMCSLLHTWGKHSWEDLSHQVSGLQSVLPTPFLHGMNGFDLIKTFQWFCNG